MSSSSQISKILSINDTGINNSHQAGILIPRNPAGILNFFPQIEKNIKNPRAVVCFKDETNRRWKFNFIYYNNKFFDGTRNEYRLTGMTEFIRTYGLTAGDEIIFKKDNLGNYSIAYKKVSHAPTNQDVTIKIGNKWKIINIHL